VRVAPFTLDEIMNGLATYQGREIRADSTETILAVDRQRSWAAAFNFGIDEDGGWSADGMKAVLTADGHWHDVGEGGSWGDSGWPSPWTAPSEGWDGRHLMVLGVVGQDVDDGVCDAPLIAVYGFASSRVAAIRVDADGADRSITPSPCGGFIALAVGTGALALTAVDRLGNPLGPVQPFGLGE
jgi:hypothetical protein